MKKQKQIRKADLEPLARTVLEGAMKFYENPENKRKFEEWKRRRNS